MINLFAIFIGSIVGLVVGFFAGWLFADFGVIPEHSNLWKGVVGGVIGGFAGAVAGSISGDANRAGESGANRLLMAFTAGAIFGVIGGTKLAVLGKLLDTISVPHPFQTF